jgi:hypothetical protein
MDVALLLVWDAILELALPFSLLYARFEFVSDLVSFFFVSVQHLIL